MTNESEARLQQECYMHFHNSYPHLRGLFFKIKNEGINRITGARDKATGLIAGVADSCLLINGTSVFIEFKTETGKQSPSQKDWQFKIESAGYMYFIVKSLNDFKEVLRKCDLLKDSALKVDCGYCFHETTCNLRIDKSINYANQSCTSFKQFAL